MKKKIITTADGSHTISIPQWRVSYHSVHGAIQESMHVFIEADYITQLTNQQVNQLPVSRWVLGPD